MSKAYILMTAMPPTKGHLALIQFAQRLYPSSVEVLVCTIPGEPLEYERVWALQNASRRLPGTPVHVHHLRGDLPEEPELAIGFWDIWAGFLTQYGLTSDDWIVSSEPYGVKLEEYTGARFIPYDVDRFVLPTRATPVRNQLEDNFADILPEFQKYLRMTVTIFGAESCGKTTLTRDMARTLNCWTLPEWARPYLETVGPELSLTKMETIHLGQSALQDSAATALFDRPYVIQDTDLFSTIGYWAMHQSPHDPLQLGRVPDRLVEDATDQMSDLYLFLPSVIPFEADPLRYGGDRREGGDEFWLDIVSEFALPCVTLQEVGQGARMLEATRIIRSQFEEKHAPLIRYRRVGANH